MCFNLLTFRHTSRNILRRSQHQMFLVAPFSRILVAAAPSGGRGAGGRWSCASPSPPPPPSRRRSWPRPPRTAHSAPWWARQPGSRSCRSQTKSSSSAPRPLWNYLSFQSLSPCGFFEKLLLKNTYPIACHKFSTTFDDLIQSKRIQSVAFG